MQPVVLYWRVDGFPDINSTQAFRCSEAECPILYDALHGYHTRPQGKVNDLGRQVSCNEHSTAMYIQQFDSQGSSKSYQCPYPACKRGQTV